MSDATAYIIDSDVFITAKNLYYAFDICPGFWDSLVYGHQNDHLRSIDKVRQELLNGRPEEDLVHWVKNDLPAEFFLTTTDSDIVSAFSEVMLWVQRSTQYLDRAKADFATKADGWLVAYAMVHGVCVATNEQSSPESRRDVKLPDACNQFGVAFADTFAMLRMLGVRYEFKGTT